MKLLSALEISPTPSQILNFINYKNVSNQQFEEIKRKLEIIENTVVKIANKEDKAHLIEFKPNFAGIGINGNEAWDRLKKHFK